MRKKKNQLSISVVFLLLLTTILSVLVSGTYAKYTKEVSGSDTAVVAKFKVSSNLNSADFNIFNTIYDNARNGEVEQDVIAGKIAPGTEGKFEVTVQNDSEVAIKYNIAISEIVNTANIPIKYSTNGSTYYNSTDFNNEFKKIEQINQLEQNSDEVTIPIYWKWEYNGNDAFVESAQLEVNVTATFTQIDKLNSNELLIPNSEFSYGCYLNATGKRTESKYGYLKVNDRLYRAQDISIKVEDTDLTNYIATIAMYDENENFLRLLGANNYMANGQIIYTKEEMLQLSPSVYYIRVNIGIYEESTATYTKIPETATINVYATSEFVSRWKGKTINVIGDSITYGHGLENRTEEVYTTLLANKTGATVNNYGVSGTRISKTADDNGSSFVDRIANMDKNADLIIVFGGTNDYWHKQNEIGTVDSEDTSTFYGALNYIYDYLQQNYSGKDYLFVFPYDQTHHDVPSNTDHGYGTLDDFRAAFEEFCQQKNVAGLDLATVTEFNCAEHTTDGVHANKEGHSIIANAIYNYIENNY